MAIISRLDFLVIFVISRIVLCWLEYKSKIFLFVSMSIDIFLFSYRLKIHPFYAKNHVLPTPLRGCFQCFQICLSSLFIRSCIHHIPVFCFLSFSLHVKVREMSHKILIGQFWIKSHSNCR
jgi:hypothetical protein